MRRLCFGGSFNPVHFGHLRCARAVARAGGFGRIALIPNAVSPHKNGAVDVAPASDRLAMCRLAAESEPPAAGGPHFEVNDVELARDTPSYTIETARELRRQGWAEVNWLIGADQLLALPTWREPHALLAEVNFVVMARPGYAIDWKRLPADFQGLRSHLVPAPLVDISATDIRRKVRDGQPIDGLTPQSVIEYIRWKGIYRGLDGI